ncbi:DUF6191 domain-containing protein [Streptomyces laculatispora]|uniref:DUF6191 domain-containing protein n=1 Tax=Streptomyces laculatispora TaxID=887464 RepID=UPI001A9462EC|nr:DUF6191 domain-containing protein [Streptomyces laculatispora]MBO0915882.1 hypothetical protein [Streptomyces laculatispora]
MFNFFEELFAPGRKHAAEEQRRLELSRVDLGIGDPARGPIDLTSGKVVVRRPDAGDAEPEGGVPGDPDPGDQGSGGAAEERGQRP